MRGFFVLSRNCVISETQKKILQNIYDEQVEAALGRRCGMVDGGLWDPITAAGQKNISDLVSDLLPPFMLFKEWLRDFNLAVMDQINAGIVCDDLSILLEIREHICKNVNEELLYSV